MKATVLDTETGATAEVGGVSTRDWTEGNWSCDCNRNVFGVGDGKVDGLCAGPKRFLVVAAKIEVGLGDFPCSLKELNDGYPEELLRKHGLLTERTGQSI